MFLQAILPLPSQHDPSINSVEDYNPLNSRQAAAPGTNDVSSAARASYAVVSLLCMLLMATLLGTRPVLRQAVHLLTCQQAREFTQFLIGNIGLV